MITTSDINLFSRCAALRPNSASDLPETTDAKCITALHKQRQSDTNHQLEKGQQPIGKSLVGLLVLQLVWQSVSHYSKVASKTTGIAISNYY